MALRKSPTLTPARLAANRRNAQKSTGPRTARGKAWSSLNALRDGHASPSRRKFLEAWIESAPDNFGNPGKVDEVVKSTLTPQQALHPAFAREIEVCRGVAENELRERMLRHPWWRWKQKMGLF